MEIAPHPERHYFDCCREFQVRGATGEVFEHGDDVSEVVFLDVVVAAEEYCDVDWRRRRWFSV